MVELSIEWGFAMLVACTTLTGLVTEAIKKMLEGRTQTKPNMIAAIVSVVVGAAVGCVWVVLSGAIMEAKTVIYVIALIVLSWLCAMLGYDKVIQTLRQIKRSE